MAANFFSEEDFSCPVCCEIFKNPVILVCSHSVCESCLLQFWETKGVKECPVCRKRSSGDHPFINLHLKNLCETFLQDSFQREPLCSDHRSELKLFCENDQQLVCLVCRDSKLHKGHNFSPISEAAAERKEELRLKLKPLEEKLQKFNEVKCMYDESMAHIKAQSQITERLIKEEFAKLHHFLDDEEGVRISALKEEQNRKHQMINEKIERMNEEISSLSDTIRVLGEMTADNITFLQSYKSTVAKVQVSLLQPETLSKPLIDVAKHLGNLKFTVWKKMQNIVQYYPVILDPNTAYHNLLVSDDLTSVRSELMQRPPDNPERFDFYPCVLGSEGFNTGTHCWDVEVGDSETWYLGVMTESGEKKGWNSIVSGVWSLKHRGNAYVSSATSLPLLPDTSLTLRQKPKKIRVKLDWNRGQLSYSDPDRNSHIHTLSHRFSEKVFPFFYNSTSLTLLPMEASVVLDKPR